MNAKSSSIERQYVEQGEVCDVITSITTEWINLSLLSDEIRLQAQHLKVFKTKMDSLGWNDEEDAILNINNLLEAFPGQEWRLVDMILELSTPAEEIWERIEHVHSCYDRIVVAMLEAWAEADAIDNVDSEIWARRLQRNMGLLQDSASELNELGKVPHSAEHSDETALRSLIAKKNAERAGEIVKEEQEK